MRLRRELQRKQKVQKDGQFSILANFNQNNGSPMRWGWKRIFEWKLTKRKIESNNWRISRKKFSDPGRMSMSNQRCIWYSKRFSQDLNERWVFCEIEFRFDALPFDSFFVTFDANNNWVKLKLIKIKTTTKKNTKEKLDRTMVVVSMESGLFVYRSTKRNYFP